MPSGRLPRRVIHPAEEMWRAGLEAPEIARLLGYTVSAIYTQLRTVGIHARDRRGTGAANRARLKAEWFPKKRAQA